MATWTYEDVTPSLIPNTTMKKGFADGVHRVYVIHPIDGYILHDVGFDIAEIDPETGEQTSYSLGYTTAGASCGASYDFSTSTVTDENGNTLTAYGERQFFARLASDVPSDQIFGGGNNHEIM